MSVVQFSAGPRQVLADHPASLTTYRVTGNTTQGVKVSQASFRQQVTEIPPMQNHVWRKTPDGWTQVPVEPAPHFLNLPHTRPRIHPFSVASLTLLLCLASMAWSSSEWDWQRFVGEADGVEKSR